MMLWPLWSFWSAFCDCNFCSGGHGIIVLASSVCPLMDESKRLVQASWWEGLALEKARSCSGGAGPSSANLSPIFCWRVGHWQTHLLTPARNWTWHYVLGISWWMREPCHFPLWDIAQWTQWSRRELSKWNSRVFGDGARPRGKMEEEKNKLKAGRMSINFAKHGLWRCVWDWDDVKCIPGYMSLLAGIQWYQRPRDIQDPEINSVWLAGLRVGEGGWAVAGTRFFKSWYELQSSSEKIRDTVQVTVSVKECHDRVLLVRISLTAFLEDRKEKLKIARCMKLRRNGRLMWRVIGEHCCYWTHSILTWQREWHAWLYSSTISCHGLNARLDPLFHPLFFKTERWCPLDGPNQHSCWLATLIPNFNPNRPTAVFTLKRTWDQLQSCPYKKF